MPKLTCEISGKLDQTNLLQDNYFQNIFILRNTAQLYIAQATSGR